MYGKQMRWLLVCALVAVAFNLRAVVTSASPVLEEIQQATGMSASVAGVLTSMPGFAFGLVGLVTPLVTRKCGLHGALALAMCALTLGIVARSYVSSAFVFIVWTTLALAGIAIANVLVPAYIKEHFPRSMPSMMTVYTVTLGVGTMLSASVAAPLAALMGWRHATALWALTACVAVVAMVLVMLFSRKARSRGRGVGNVRTTCVDADSVSDTQEVSVLSSAQEVAEEAEPTGRPVHASQRHISLKQMLKSSKARWIALFFGVQSLHAYVQMGWLAQICRDQGVSAGQAGLMIGLVQFIMIPGGFIAPVLATKAKNPRIVVVAMALTLLPGYAGVLWVPSLMWLWIVLIAISNMCFPIALMMISSSGRTPEGTQSLSALSQGVGYVIAGFGPLLVGVLHAVNNGWLLPIIFLLVTVPVFAYAGNKAAQPGFVEDELGLS